MAHVRPGKIDVCVGEGGKAWRVTSNVEKKRGVAISVVECIYACLAAQHVGKIVKLGVFFSRKMAGGMIKVLF